MILKLSTNINRFKWYDHFLFINSLRHQSNQSSSKLYIQGQNDPERPKIREYFYYIDHNGMLFLDDSRMKNFTSCFKEKQFLNFFFKNIKFNKMGRYEKEFPYISLCGIERNFIRCDDVPIVYTHIVPNTKDSSKNEFNLIIANSDLVFPFNPESLYMLPESINTEKDNDDDDDDDQSILKHGGRIYHEADDRFGSYGLIRSMLAQEIGNLFVLNEQKIPIIFKWNGVEYRLSNRLASIVIGNKDK
ncbi:hypothetical protein DERF_002893 [Dermatophagoides farinae]|uniref:Uncharacterized protein n=1 Tax=Dermatophagoides farinae TaxID=6954 RepID=A0A922LAY6_DERFA|nr:hypothetical protein DERF_002893 [Dermatophagoides farinae]